MNISRALVLYFTGTGTTKQYAEAFAEALPYPTEIDEIRHDNSLDETLKTDELLVLAAPVYGGFLPPFVWNQIKAVKGTNTPAVLLAVYGARDYDNALLEMGSKLSEQGFATIGAAAVVAKHSIDVTIASDRPNNEDITEIKTYAQTVAERLTDMTSLEDAPTFNFKGTLERGAAKPSPTPEATDECTECGICSFECPTGAIPEDCPNTTDAETCIACMRCVDICPFGARLRPAAMVEHASAMLAKCADPKKKNEFF